MSRSNDRIADVMLSLPLIPPVLREGRGDVEAALDGWLPELIEQRDRHRAITERGSLLCMQTMTTDARPKRPRHAVTDGGRHVLR